MAQHVCDVCGFTHDEERSQKRWDELPANWKCPVCGTGREGYHLAGQAPEGGGPPGASSGAAPDEYLGEWRRLADEREEYMEHIHAMAATGRSVIEPMRTRKPVVQWDDLLLKGAQLARFPLNRDEPVSLRTVIGPGAAQPLEIETPVFVTHMSFGALSREVQTALAKGSAAVRTAIGSGEGGILEDCIANAYRYIFEYVPNKYSVSDENLRRVHAVEIKFGQSVKPGMGGHLPGEKVTEEIAAVRGFPPGKDIISPSRFAEIRGREDLKRLVDELRRRSGGKPIGVKIAAGHIEEDIEFALHARPDFLTVDGRPGATGAAAKFIKDATSIPTVYALYRARRCLDRLGAKQVSLVITGGLRVSSDFARALALGADAVAVGTAALMACCCQQYRVCNTGRCPVGCTTQDPELRARIEVETSARRVANYLRVCTEELADFARLTGRSDIHDLDLSDLCTTSSELSAHTGVHHV